MTTFFNPLRPALNGTATESLEASVPEPVLTETPSVAHAWESAAVKRVNMRDYGFEQSGLHRGDAAGLDNLLRQIMNGRLIDENANLEQQQQYQAQIGEEIAELEKQAEEVLTQQRRITEVDIPKAEAEIHRLEEEMHQIRVDEAKGYYAPNTVDRFSLWKFGVASVVGLVYVFCFYLSAVYSGMIRNIGTEIESVDGTASASTLFSNIFVKGAFSTFDFHWIAPVLLLMFAFVLDYLWDHTEGKARMGWMIGVAAMVLFLDALIAFKIEEQAQSIKRLMGLEDPNHHWWSSTDFWIVLVMGFVATLGWGVLVYAFKTELGKTDARKIVNLEIQHRLGLKATVEQLIFDLKGQLTELGGKLNQLYLGIKRLKEKQKTLKVSLSELEKSVTDFYDGWLAYLNSRGNCEPVKRKCEAVMAEFSAAYFREPASPPAAGE
jgi:hypothetical protein